MRDRGTDRPCHVWLLLPLLAGLACGAGTSHGSQCLYAGRSRAVGDTFPSSDGCNTCSCTSGGVACTTRACPPDGGGADTSNTSEAGSDANNLPDAGAGDTSTTSDATSGDTSTDATVASCTYGGRAYGVGDRFPSTDGCNTCVCDLLVRESGSFPAVGCTLLVCADALPSDNCSFDRTYTFWDDGGFVAYTDRSTLAPARAYSLTRDHLANAPPTACSRQLVCNDPAGADVSEIQLALAHADVVAALAMATKPFYGTDTRPVDGTVFVLERDDQRGFTVGSGPVPPGLRALVDLLHALHSETAASPGCANL